MTITAIILAHFKEREVNLQRIVDDLLTGTVKPEKIIIFIDNSEIKFEDERVTIIRSDHSFKPNIRFALGSVCETDYCFFIDDDLSVQSHTLENFQKMTEQLPESILGLEGSILGDTPTPYSNDKSINRGVVIAPTKVSVIIRTYFTPVKSLPAGLILRSRHPELPQDSLDDIFLSFGNIIINNKPNYVIPIIEDSNLIELSEGGVGQSHNGEHYNNRNIVCRFLLDTYKK